MENLMCPAIIAELKNANLSVGGGAGEKATELMGCPAYHIYGSSVEGEVEHAAPGG